MRQRNAASSDMNTYELHLFPKGQTDGMGWLRLLGSIKL